MHRTEIHMTISLNPHSTSLSVALIDYRGLIVEQMTWTTPVAQEDPREFIARVSRAVRTEAGRGGQVSLF